MKPDTYFIPFAQAAYDDYGKVTDHKNYQGLPMPLWEALTPTIQSAWIGAVKSVFAALGNEAAMPIADIPYFSQWANDAHTRTSDCGATCVHMLAASMGIQTTTDAITIESQPNGITSAANLVSNFAKLGILATPYTKYDPEPVKGGDICLVTYGALHGQQDVKFKGLHWLVYLGTEGDDVVVNDPNYFGDRIGEGAAKHYSQDDWSKAFTGQSVRAIPIPKKGTQS